MGEITAYRAYVVRGSKLSKLVKDLEEPEDVEYREVDVIVNR